MMSGNDSSATATLTPTSVAVVSTVISTAEEEEEDPAALTLDCVADMDLVNGPNPWLPAYGFQLQHHSQFQPTHLEDLRANDTVLVQQVDFLETILEETSDDLQSDSDRSGTTYWLGSDSETESVIHIKTKQRSADERLDGSGSECNSVVPKKRRRRDHGADHHHHHHHHQQVTAYDEYPASPRSSRSTASSRSSSLLQFESLERTCATLSPSSYSFDSLEYSNRSNTSHPENDSPDSLEQDYDRLLPNGFASTLSDHFPRIRPYRSFESLDTCQKDEGFGQASMSNGFAPLYLKRGADLSNIRKNNQRPRDFWHEDEEYEDDDNDEEEDDEYDFEEYERGRTNADSQLTTGFEDRLLLYGESGKYATSLDYRNTIDLREIGLETKRDALLELKSGQKTARLNIAGSGAEHHHHHHHHHHQHHPQQQQQYQQQQYDQHDHHHHHHRRRRQQQQQGWSDEEHFNFRFTDKSQSAPSLLDGVEESTRSGLSCSSLSRLRTSRTTSYVSTSSLFENYTRVASVPVDLNLCGVAATCDDDMNGREMAELAPDDEAATLKSSQDDAILKRSDETQAGTKVALTSSVRTQPAQGALMDGNMEDHEKENEERTKVERASDHCEMPQTLSNKQTKTTSTVKTQDRSNCVLDMTMVTENDLDEAIKQFKREVEEATASEVTNAAILAMEMIQRTPSGRLRSRKVKNNASYELAQQLEVDERNFQRKLKDNDENRDGASSPGKRRVLNNASYDLAQQCDYIKALQGSRAAFQRMDACDELEESASGRSSGLKVADVMRQMGSDTNISEDSRPKEPPNDSFFGQIKKNSDPFSACGDASALSPRLLDDEVDYPCLETKPIGVSCLENRVVLREKIESEKPTQLKSVLENSSARSSHVNEESSSKRSEEETGDVKKSFIGEFYPERAAQLTQQCLQAGESKIQERKMNSENALSNRDQDRSGSPGSSDRGAGERLWRVVIEKQATAKKEEEKEEEEREGVEAVEKKEVEEEGHSVRGVGSVSPPDGPGSLGECSSGKPAMAVVAVDTNHRGGDRDKRQGDEQQRAPSINKLDASVANAKRSSSVAPKRESAKAYAASSISLPSSSSSAAMKSEERKKGGLGGFLQRFSRLRFSGRTKVPRSEAHKKVAEATTRTQEEQQPATAKKKEPDYIIIPLHPPEEERRRQQEVVTLEEAARRNNVDIQRSASSVSNGRAPVSSKPPLPPQPPRVAALGTTMRASASASRRRAATDLGNPAAIEMAKARAMQAAQERPVGLLETDLDEAVINTSYNGTTYTAGPTAVSAAAAATTAAAATAAAAAAAGAGGKKTRSLLDLNHTSAAAPRPRPEHALHVPQSPVGATHRSPRDDVATSAIHQRPHKSMEFLLDKENLHFVKPPENELQKVGERVPSEHELRVQRSLQRLNVPDWYKNSPAARDGFRLKRHSDASQHGGWRALGSKTTSLSSLSSSSNRQPTTGVLLSPSPTPPVFSRWSTSLLNSAGSSPASSARSSFNHRQPYLGWRSQERLANPRTPAERLAQGILPQLQAANKQQQQQQQQTTNQQLEVRNSIKEVTSAIVHYVQSGQEVSGGGGGGGRLSPRPRPEDWDDRGGARSTSPRGSVKLCWMESSFVGTRPVDSPETPMSLATDQEGGDCCNAAGTESCSCQDSAASGLYLDLTPSRDDVRHQHHQTPSAGLSPTSSSNYHHLHHQRHRQQQQQRHHRGSGQSDTDEAMATAALLRNKPSPGSTTLEDVLDSLLGLPPASRTPSPGPGGPVVTATSAIRHRHTNAAVGQAKAGKSCSDLRQDLQESAKSVMDVHEASVDEQRSFYSGELVRRKSEGSDTLPASRAAVAAVAAASSSLLMPRGGVQPRHRRVSFDNAQDSTTNGSSAMDKVVRCRNNKCGNSTTLAEARRTYKSCHNCTCLYCSRECRRAHWQRHRRTCLHSRAGSLCRQVLSSAKEDPSTLKHISALARRGYAAHGRGAVKCFFSSPESAERFVGNGFADLGEPTYVRWSDLLPGEMGAELYAELMRLCKTYNPEARLVLYVAVCVVSEVPTSGAVRWERQLVSRCAKIRLDGAAKQHASSSSASPQARRRLSTQQAPASPCNITREMDSPETLVLTSLPGNNGQNTPRRAREISFTNIQRQLRLRGVSLRRHFPQVYRKLCSYVDGSVDKFAPVTIYPRDQASGKSFMCIIMLDAEPERLQLLPTDSSRVRTVDISVEQE